MPAPWHAKLAEPVAYGVPERCATRVADESPMFTTRRCKRPGRYEVTVDGDPGLSGDRFCKQHGRKVADALVAIHMNRRTVRLEEVQR